MKLLSLKQLFLTTTMFLLFSPKVFSQSENTIKIDQCLQFTGNGWDTAWSSITNPKKEVFSLYYQDIIQVTDIQSNYMQITPVSGEFSIGKYPFKVRYDASELQGLTGWTRLSLRAYKRVSCP